MEVTVLSLEIFCSNLVQALLLPYTLAKERSGEHAGSPCVTCRMNGVRVRCWWVVGWSVS